MNLQNLIDYCRETDLPDPFSGATVPAPLNIDTVKSAIMVRCGLLTPIYGEPSVFRNMTTHWFQTKQWTFEHLINIIQAEYSPIENVDEYYNEKTKYGHNNTKTGGYTDTEDGTDTVTNSGTDTVTNSGTDTVALSGTDTVALSGTDTVALSGTDTVTLSGTDTVAASGTDTVALSGTDERDISEGGTDTTTNTISAFNSSGFQNDNQSETAYGKTTDDDVTYGKTEDTTYGKSEDTTYGKSEDTTYGKSEDTTYGKSEDTTYGKSEDTTYGHTIETEHGHEVETAYGHSLERVYNSEKDQEGGTDEIIRRRHGNIGVTSNQQLINAELELLRHFDIYGYIAELFEDDMFIMVY